MDGKLSSVMGEILKHIRPLLDGWSTLYIYPVRQCHVAKAMWVDHYINFLLKMGWIYDSVWTGIIICATTKHNSISNYIYNIIMNNNNNMSQECRGGPASICGGGMHVKPW